jgi:hypothetical protein
MNELILELTLLILKQWLEALHYDLQMLYSPYSLTELEAVNIKELDLYVDLADEQLKRQHVLVVLA